MGKTIPSQALKYAKSKAKRMEKLKADPTCRICGITKTVDDFPKNTVDYSCTECRSKDSVKRYHKKRKALSDRELRSLKKKVNNRNKRYRAEKLARMSPEERRAYHDKVNAENLARRNALRDEVYEAYGGYICACCGETERAFLSFDHINNDGSSHKREHGIKTGEQLHRWLKRNNYPPGFQVLCMNCNWGKRNNNGVCPHVSGKV